MDAIEPVMDSDVGLPRRPPSDFGPRVNFMDWARRNATLVGAASFIATGIVFSVVFYVRLSDMIPIVAQLRKDLDEAQQSLKQVRSDITAATERTNELRKHLDDTLNQADTVRGKLNDTDNQAAILMARMQERINSLETHSPPLPFQPPPGHGR